MLAMRHMNRLRNNQRFSNKFINGILSVWQRNVYETRKYCYGRMSVVLLTDIEQMPEYNMGI